MAERTSGRRVPVAVWGIAAAKIALHLSTVRLSYHRDELYFIAASKRLAVSYVDFQPITPVLVRIARLFGESVFGLRVITALAGAAVIVLGAALTRELGGDRRAQTFAALALLLVPLFVGMNSLLNTVTLETPAFLGIVLCVARLIRSRNERWWLAIGAAIGLALLVKFTVVGYLLALVPALIFTEWRRSLRLPWLWAGAAVAAVMLAPSVMWQFTHDLAIVEFVSNQGGGGAVLGLRGRLGYIVSLIVLPGPFALLVTVPGLRRLARSRDLRLIWIWIATSLVVFFIASGKGYYAAPAIAVVLCAGAVAMSEWSRRRTRLVVAALVVNLLIPLILVVPILPVSYLRGRPDLADATELGERLGWDDLGRTVGEVAATLDDDERERAIVLGGNYALASAVEFYRDDFHTPPAVSGHNSSYLWWPRIARDHVAITIGFEARELRPLYGSVECVAKVTNREGVDNYEYGRPICIGRDPKVSPAQLRERVKTFQA